MTSAPDDGAGDRTRLDPGRAPRDPGAAGDQTRLDPGRHSPGDHAGEDDWADEPGWGEGGLPPPLAGRFALISEMPGEANEARLFLVREHGGDRLRVLKIYRHGCVPDDRVWAWLAVRGHDPGRSAHLAEVSGTGFTDGRRRAYEVMEYLGGGDLRELSRSSPERLDPPALAVVVEQLAQALAEMHAAGIVHRDVKPANVLVRSLAPLDVALADFGVSAFTGSALSTSTGPGGQPLARLLTSRYAAPEWLVAGSLSPAADWWALGMTVAELASGRHPFGAWTDELILRLFATARPVNLSGVTGPRLRLLCRGLLVREDAARWGYEQVSAWLRGESPGVADEYAADGTAAEGGQSREPFVYKGTPYADPVQLAAVLAEDWDAAAGLFFPARRGDAKPWRRLRRWLATLDGPERPDGSRAELIRVLEKGRETPHVRLYRLLRWLYPAGPPVYRRAEITSADLPGLARRAAGAVASGAQGIGQGAARDIVEDLWRDRLLPDLAQATRGAGLSDADRRWRQWHEYWLDLADTTGRQPRVGQYLRDVPEATVLSYLLWLAAEEQTARAWLGRVAARERAALPESVPWFSGLTRPDGDVLSLLCAVLLAGPARLEAQRVAEERAAERARLRRLLEGQAVAAWFRRHDRPTALGWAAGGVALVAVFWSWVIALTDLLPFASARAVALAWACVILSVVVLATAELSLAAVVGGPYHPPYSLIGAGITGMARAARAVRHRGLLVLAILAAGVAALLAATSYLPFLLPLASTAGELAWVRSRYRRWRADQEARARDIARAEAERRAERASRA